MQLLTLSLIFKSSLWSLCGDPLGVQGEARIPMKGAVMVVMHQGDGGDGEQLGHSKAFLLDLPLLGSLPSF